MEEIKENFREKGIRQWGVPIFGAKKFLSNTPHFTFFRLLYTALLKKFMVSDTSMLGTITLPLVEESQRMMVALEVVDKTAP